MRKTFPVAAVVLLCAVGGLRAQDASPETLAVAKELAAVISVDTINQLSEAMTAQIWPKLEAELGRKVDQATLQELRKQFEAALARFVSQAMDDAPAIYARHFTAQELRDIAAFYKTASGRKALQKMPQVTAESFGAIMPRMKNFQAELEDIIDKIMTQRGYKK
jgi:uncharacterized protein